MLNLAQRLLNERCLLLPVCCRDLHLSKFKHKQNAHRLMKKLFTTILLLSAITFSGQAQSYKTAIGFKGAFPGFGALSVKHFFSPPNAFEINLGAGYNSFWVQAFYMRNHDLGSEGLEWYWGLGGDAGSWGNSYYHNRYYGKKHDYKGGGFLGADAVVGLEYTFNEIPINLAVDFGPTLRILPYTAVYFGGSFAIRFAIK